MSVMRRARNDGVVLEGLMMTRTDSNDGMAVKSYSGGQIAKLGVVLHFYYSLCKLGYVKVLGLRIRMKANGDDGVVFMASMAENDCVVEK